MILIETRCFQETVARRPLADQRRLADLAESAGRKRVPDPSFTSRSHSRGVAMTALGATGVCALGVDVEHIDPRRPWRDILTFAGATKAAAASDAACCRAWTILEAWYKAFATRIPPSILDAGLTFPEDDMVVALGNDTWRMSLSPMMGFQASVVWTGRQVAPHWSIMTAPDA